MDNQDEDYDNNNDLNIYSSFLQLQFENEQLRFENESLNKIIDNKNITIKLLENTLLENRDWDEHDYQKDNNKNMTEIDTTEIVPEQQIISINAIQNNINWLLIKKGIYNRLTTQYLGNKNIDIK